MAASVLRRLCGHSAGYVRRPRRQRRLGHVQYSRTAICPKSANIQGISLTPLLHLLTTCHLIYRPCNAHKILSSPRPRDVAAASTRIWKDGYVRYFCMPAMGAAPIARLCYSCELELPYLPPVVTSIS